MAEGERTHFSYEEDQGQSFGYVVPIGGTGWSVLQLFPSQALRTIVNQVNQDEHFALLLLGAVVVWFAVQLVYITKHKAAMEHGEKGRERMIALLEGVADDYLCLIDVDLTTKKEEQFRLYQGTALADWAQGDYDYDHCIQSYAQSVVSPADRVRDCLQKINLSGEHLLRLIGNVLDMARIESGKCPSWTCGPTASPTP